MVEGDFLFHRLAAPRTRVFLVFALALLMLGWGLWSTPLLSHNEARRMVVAQEMVRGGSWLLPTMNGELYITKPPLYTWLQAALAELFGATSLFVLRLPSLLAALATLLLVWRWARRHLQEGTAELAVLLLAASPLFVFHGRFAEIEMVLALFNSAAVLWYFDYLEGAGRGRLRLAWAALGLAVLTKGPVALLFFLPPILLYGLVWERRALRGLADPLSWLLFLAIALPWYLYVLATVDPETIRAILHRDIVEKASRSGGTPFYKYLLDLLGGFFPWLLLLFTISPRKLKTPGTESWLAVAALLPVAIMSLFSAKHAKYILPVFPLLALWLASLLRQWMEKRAGRQRLVQVVLALLLLGLFVFHAFLAPHIWLHRHVALEPIAKAAKAYHLPLVAVGPTPIQLVYYYGKPVPVRSPAELEVAKTHGEALLVLADDRFWKRLDQAGLCVLEEWPVYLKKKRKARLYGVGGACSSARQQVEQHQVPQQQEQ